MISVTEKLKRQNTFFVIRTLFDSLLLKFRKYDSNRFVAICC